MGANVRRRILATGSIVLGVPRIALAQTRKRLPSLGVLNPFAAPTPEAIAGSPFYKRLRELGWKEGETLRFERASAENSFSRLPELAAALVERRVDAIWAIGPAAAVAAARATKEIPIVFWWTALPIELGLIESYASPGRNVTGAAWSAASLVENYLKQAQILREIAPDARRLARLRGQDWLHTVAGELWDGSSYQASIDSGVRGLGFDTRRFEPRTDSDLNAVFDAIVQWRADSLFVQAGDLIARAGKRVVDFARRNRLPDIHSFHHLVEQGGLISYSFDPTPSMLRTAEYVDRILRGAKPADLPVQLPTHYNVVVNLKTARSLGLSVPQSILLRADRTIE